MPTSPPSQREPSFVDKIAQLASSSSAAVQDVNFREIIDDFVEGLRRARLGAGVRAAEDENLIHIVVWPRYRPGWFTLLLTLQISPAAVVILSEPSVTLHTRDDLSSWLLTFTQSDACQAIFQSLRAQALSPIDARFEADDGAEILLHVSASKQELIHESTADLELTLDVPNEAPTPPRYASGWFRSAGVERRCTVHDVAGSTLTLTLFTAG